MNFETPLAPRFHIMKKFSINSSFLKPEGKEQIQRQIYFVRMQGMTWEEIFKSFHSCVHHYFIEYSPLKTQKANESKIVKQRGVSGMGIDQMKALV